MVSTEYIFNKSSQSIVYVLVVTKLPEERHIGPGLPFALIGRFEDPQQAGLHPSWQSGLTPRTGLLTLNPVNKFFVAGSLLGPMVDYM